MVGVVAVAVEEVVVVGMLLMEEPQELVGVNVEETYSEEKVCDLQIVVKVQDLQGG